ncbi:MAG: PAS domain S-box protein [Thermoanaerobaculia bacterium]|jgi:PAS domain S-box-containing protein
MAAGDSTPLEWSEEILHEIFRNAEIGFVLLDLRGMILEANGAFCRILDADPSRVLTRAMLDFVDAADKAEVGALFEQLVQGERESYRVSRHYRAADGGVVSTRVTGSTVRSRSRELVCAVELIEDVGPILEAERALRESELRYRTIVEDQGEYIVRWLPDGTRTFVNEAYARYVGRPAAELLGTSFFPLILDEADRQTVRQKIASLTPANPIATNQHQARTAEGELRWQQWSDRAFFDDEGRVRLLQSVGRDITEEKLAQASVAASEERFRRLFRDLPIAAWESDWSGMVEFLRSRGVHDQEELRRRIGIAPSMMMEVISRIRTLDVNRKALEMFGVDSLADYRKAMSYVWAVANPADLTESAGALVFSPGGVATAEVTVRDVEGRQIDLIVEWARIASNDGPWRVVSTGIDVTRRRAAERHLERQRSILEQAETIAHVGSWEWDAAKKLIFGSREYWNVLYGVSSGAGTRDDSAFFDRIHPDDIQKVAQRIELRTDVDIETDASTSTEFRIIRPDGTVRTVLARSFFRRNEDGHIASGYGVLTDVTEQKIAEAAAERQREQLIRADKLISLGTLVSGVAHEINNPNHFIMLNAPLIQKAWDEIVPIVDAWAQTHPALRVGGLPWSEMRAEAHEIASDILAGADRINTIVSDLKGFTRDAEPGSETRIDVNDIVRGAQRLLGSRIRKATDNFRSELGPGLPSVAGNPRRLEQVVINLIQNACDALAETRGTIVVATRQDGDEVVIEVRDQGTGIAPEHMNHLFDPFFTTKRAEGGTGLGLPISHRIVTDHGGQLLFESAPGKGTTATVRLPVWKEIDVG